MDSVTVTILLSPTRNPSKVVCDTPNGFEHSGKRFCGAMSLFQLHSSLDPEAELQLARGSLCGDAQYVV